MYIQIWFVIILFHFIKCYQYIEVFLNLIEKSKNIIVSTWFYLAKIGLFFLFGIICYSFFDSNLHIPVLIIINIFISILLSYDFVCFVYNLTFCRKDFVCEILLFTINLLIILIQIM
jgi:hypothetical protein